MNVGNGTFGLGYNRVQDLSLPPEGAIYIKLNNTQDIEAVTNLLQKLSTRPICIILPRSGK